MSKTCKHLESSRHFIRTNCYYLFLLFTLWYLLLSLQPTDNKAKDLFWSSVWLFIVHIICENFLPSYVSKHYKNLAFLHSCNFSAVKQNSKVLSMIFSSFYFFLCNLLPRERIHYHSFTSSSVCLDFLKTVLSCPNKKHMSSLISVQSYCCVLHLNLGS